MSDQATDPKASLLRKVLIDLAVMCFIGLMLALLGPFGSYTLSFPQRLVYWVTLSLTGYFCYVPISGAILRFCRGLELPELFGWVVAVLVATIPMTLVVMAVAFILGGVVLPSFESAVSMYGHVLVIGAGITVIFHLAEGTLAHSRLKADGAPDTTVAESTQNVPPNHANAPGRRANFLDRLPAELGSDLIALEMEDHYVRAHTALGSDLVLMRMRDAVAELDGIDGAQVHRSWWVARGAVEDVQRDGRNVRLQLANGIEAPVSRANVATLKKAGWF